MSSSDADIVIVGGGIAGLAAAYFAQMRQRRVVLIDRGIATASQVPTALINPVRGYRARVSDDGIEGAKLSFELIEALVAAGHPIRFGQGLWRPVPDMAQVAEWRALLPAHLAHEWQRNGDAQRQLRGEWAATLYLPHSGWVETAGFLAALDAASGATRISQRVVSIEDASTRVVLEDGTTLRARQVLWCGGAWGAAQFARKASFRPGSVVVTTAPLSEQPISYGLYCVPHGSGSLIGPTTEPLFHEYPRLANEGTVTQQLIERAAALFREPVCEALRWRGVRLESALFPEGIARLPDFGSRGYLLAPRAAQAWARTL